MKIVLIVVGVIVAVLLAGLFGATRGLKDIRKLEIGEVDLSSLTDGVYEGSYRKTRWNYNVRLTVHDGRINDVQFIEKPDDGEFSDKAAQALLDAQSVAIDTVSGASINTRAFRKAVENALSQDPVR